MKIQTKIFLTICAISMTHTISYAQFNTVSMEKSFYKVEVATASDKVDEDNRRGIVSTPETVTTEHEARELTPVSIFRLPLDTLVATSPYGYRIDPFTRKRKMHSGIDFRASSDKVYAMMPGRVLKVGYDKISGNYVTLQHGSITVSYCHLSQVLKNKNELVTVGEVVGVTGNTGRSTGEHLHLTCKIKGRAIDPSLILDYITRLTLNPNDVRPNT
ncbi:M23 family metallopeptidase [Bacteroides thetaiotaomicron]|jgi:murein DD-endopeptidase|uniref:M23 family metallopeptidase n=1 Tax=Bacteroides thetaiotaomicron TaxID=818 RepID=UPI0034A4C341